MPDPERRTKRRYPLQLNLRYCSTNSKLMVVGTGQTLNVSSGGLLIAAPQPVQKGVKLRLTVEWPWLLDEVTPLQLVAESRVVRILDEGFAVQLERYQFRTSKRQSVSPAPLAWAAESFTA